ncbi:hypothetical protein RRG08_042873 [Elysia crispata]|uniref:Uncharacterized protein n=1 Tax=Elysia crispata TaxID=231223 RepID=A0AAE0YTU1_9GAST|nr:hypothetical protein RRG08_042873 [Elysia crispata]
MHRWYIMVRSLLGISWYQTLVVCQGIKPQWYVMVPSLGGMSWYQASVVYHGTKPRWYIMVPSLVGISWYQASLVYHGTKPRWYIMVPSLVGISWYQASLVYHGTKPRWYIMVTVLSSPRYHPEIARILSRTATLVLYCGLLGFIALTGFSCVQAIPNCQLRAPSLRRPDKMEIISRLLKREERGGCCAVSRLD